MEKVESGLSEGVEIIEDEHQFVSFEIGSETYGVQATKVQAIIEISEITHVPNTFIYMKGVINLRGNIVPVLDMRIKLKLEEREYDSHSVIIIVKVNDRNVGIIVDSVSDVISIPVKGIQETPHFTTQIEADFIESIGQLDKKLVIILNVDRIITDREMNDIIN